MNPQQLIDAIYLGDRACKAIFIDCWSKIVAIKIDVISKIKAGATNWDFYINEDIVDGWLVFGNVCNFEFKPPGFIPNDYINEITVKITPDIDGQSVYIFVLSINSVDCAGNNQEVTIRITAGTLNISQNLPL